MYTICLHFFHPNVYVCNCMCSHHICVSNLSLTWTVNSFLSLFYSWSFAVIFPKFPNFILASFQKTSFINTSKTRSFRFFNETNSHHQKDTWMMLFDLATQVKPDLSELGIWRRGEMVGGFFGLMDLKQLSSVQNPGWLFDIGDYTTQLYGDYNKPI